MDVLDGDADVASWALVVRLGVDVASDVLGASSDHLQKDEVARLALSHLVELHLYPQLPSGLHTRECGRADELLVH